MTRPTIRAIPSAGLLVLLLGPVSLAGCFNPFDPRIAPGRGISEPAPVPNSPQNVLRLFEWCWDHRAIQEYREIFTDDFEFQFGSADSSGNVERPQALTREEELATAENLFVRGSAREPPANSIQLSFDSNLFALPDSRPGKNSRWHREIATNVTLAIDTDAENFRVHGVARFFVVRGDSAVIPQELLERGFSKTDSTRWYIERWNDETIGAGNPLVARLPPAEGLRVATPATTQPLRDRSWGRVKMEYLPWVTPAATRTADEAAFANPNP